MLGNAADAATCLQSYDKASFPRGTDWGFTRFFVPNAVASGYNLADDAQLLWNSFEKLHNRKGLAGRARDSDGVVRPRGGDHAQAQLGGRLDEAAP